MTRCGTHPTPYNGLNDVLVRLKEEIREALREDLIGIYLQGSFAIGDFDRHSDVDFIVAVQRDLTARQIGFLQGVHARLYDLSCPWAQHLEGSYFPRDVLRSADRRGEDLWYLEHGSRSLILSTHCNTLVVRSTVREHGVVLHGPPPVDMIDAIPVSALKDEIRTTMREWGREILEEPQRFENRFYQCFIVLSYCRMLHDLETGRLGSKRSGAEWACGVLGPEWSDLIDRAWSGRPDPARSVREPADREDFRRTLELVRHALGLVDDR
jgi:hypothetical protein